MKNKNIRNADTEAINEVIKQAVVETAKATVLVISGESRRESIHSKNIVHMGPLDTEQDPPYYTTAVSYNI